MLRTLRQFLAFTKNGILEALRNKVLYAVLIAAGLTILAAAAFGALSLHHEERLFNNLVLFVGTLFLSALAIYQGVTSLHRELQTKTIFTVLSKPVPRATFLVGKFTASVVVLAICAILLFGIKLIVAQFFGYDITTIHFAAYFTTVLSLTIIVALAHFFAAFSGPLLSALFTFSIFVLGSLTPQLAEASREFERQDNPVHHILDMVLWVLPDLEKLNLSYELTHSLAVSASYLLHALVYTSTVSFFLLFFAHQIFSRRDFS